MNQYKPLSTQERIAPFLALLEARYLPLLLAVAHQAYTMHIWLWQGSDQSSAALFFSVIGALGYESIYVGAIAWTVEGKTSPWTWVTSVAALVFSVAVAVYVYWDSQGYAALLHAGFPIVGFCYTMALHHMQAQPATLPATESPQPIAPPVPAALSLLQSDSEPVAPLTVTSGSVLPDWLMDAAHDMAAPQEEPDTSKLHLSKRVPAILKNRPDISNAELYALLPGESQSSIRKYVSDWRKEQLATTSHNGNGRH